SLNAPVSDADWRLLLEGFNISGPGYIQALTDIVSLRAAIEFLLPIRGDRALSIVRKDIEGARRSSEALKAAVMPVLIENHREEGIKLIDAIIDEEVAIIAALA
ncbi:hypothetical protein H0H87_003371, partial [Tephrocybe sp. NHM501043]